MVLYISAKTSTARHRVFNDDDVVGFPEKSTKVLLTVAPKFEISLSGSTSRQKIPVSKITRMRTNRRLGNMVAVMANEQQQFESLVTQLMSPENNIRNQAEVGKPLFFSLESFHCFTYLRNYIEACCRENVFEKFRFTGRIRLTLHAMCMLKFEVLFDVFKALHFLSLRRNSSSSCFLKRHYSVERTGCFGDIFTHVFSVFIREPSVHNASSMRVYRE